MEKCFIEEMSWYEIRNALEHGVDTVIICAASQEQHGPHLAENTDSIIGTYWYGEVAKRLHALVAPIIRPGLSAHHMGLPGSVTLRPEIFRGIVEDYVDAYRRHGFKKMALCSSHGGNFVTMAELAEELNAKYSDVLIVSGMSVEDFAKVCETGDEMFGLERGSCGGHACCLETSIMLYVRPDLVNMEDAVRGYMGTDTEASARKMFANGVLGLSESGVIGDPTLATAEMGKAFLELLCDLTCEILESKLCYEQRSGRC